LGRRDTFRSPIGSVKREFDAMMGPGAIHVGRWYWNALDILRHHRVWIAMTVFSRAAAFRF